MSKFKVGQKVKLVGDEYPGTGLDLNTVHPIHSLSGSGYYIRGTTKGRTTDDFYFIESELEAVEEAAPEKVFTLGKKVRILETGRYFGKIGTVTEVDRHLTEITSYPYRVTFEDHDSNIYLASELEAVEETPKVSTKFYVVDLDYVESFNTQEEAEVKARKMAESFDGDTSLVVQVVKAFRVTSEAQEVTLA